MIRLRRSAAVLAISTIIASAPPPASAQMTVFDPSNFSQNVLTAARALQQVTNQITSLRIPTQVGHPFRFEVGR